jgi:hypothetical protein
MMLMKKIVKDYPSEIPHSIKVTLRQNIPKKEPPPPPPKQTLQEAQGELLEYIQNYKEPRTKRLYSDIFMDAPSKKLYPEYYAFIKHVICINDIKVLISLEINIEISEEQSIQELGRL